MTTDTSTIPTATLVQTAARLALAALFLVSGVAKALSFSAVAGWIGQVGLPAPQLVLAATLVLELVGGALFALGWQVRPLAFAFALFSLAAGVLFHPFWSADAAAFDNELTHFLKNLALVGGLVAFAELHKPRRRAAGLASVVVTRP